MPGRLVPLITDEHYHILNRSVEHRPIFINRKNHQRFLEAIAFYQFISPPVKFSRFLILSKTKRQSLLKKMNGRGERLIEMIVYCLMPNHFHFLLKQKTDNGISKFMSLIQNSYTKYFNSRFDRNGPLFQGQFRAVRIETEGQFLHLSRYIHLNPYSSYIVKSLNDLKKYFWSSLPAYLEGRRDILVSGSDFFKENAQSLNYQKFVFDRADFQRGLDRIKHLTQEN